MQEQVINLKASGLVVAVLQRPFYLSQTAVKLENAMKGSRDRRDFLFHMDFQPGIWDKEQRR
jgi:hypothetical protein